MLVYLLLCVSACLYGASSSQVPSTTLVLNRRYMNVYRAPLGDTGPQKYVDASKLQRTACRNNDFRQYTLSIQPEWLTDLNKPDSNFIIAQGLLDSWNPLRLWNQWDSFGKVAPVIVDIRYLPVDEESIDVLRNNPPSPHTRLIVNTRDVKYFDSKLPAQISEENVVSIINAWRQEAAQYDQRSSVQVVFDAAYKLRYYLATAAVAYAGYRYVQSNHATWVSQQLTKRNNIMTTITTLQDQMDTTQAIIAQARNGATTHTGTQVAHAFDTINAVGTELSRVTLSLADTPEWDRWSSLLKTIKDKWFLLIKSLGATWLFDIYIVRKLLAYAPFEYPSMEIRNDIRAYNCGRLHHLANGMLNSRGFICCNSRLEQSLTYAPASLSDKQKKVFARNRKIAGGVVLMGLGAGSFYAGRMLYHNADKIMAMLPGGAR